jgi:hypothetical protein
MTRKTAAAVVVNDYSVPLNQLIIRRQSDLEISNIELARLLGYPSGNVIAMIRNGNMSFPLNKVEMLAKALELDPVVVLTKALEQKTPELAQVIKSVLRERLITEQEMKLVEFAREKLEGAELDLMRHPDFVLGLKPLLHDVKEREKKLHSAAMDAIARDYVPGPKARKAA